MKDPAVVEEIERITKEIASMQENLGRAKAQVLRMEHDTELAIKQQGKYLAFLRKQVGEE